VGDIDVSDASRLEAQRQHVLELARTRLGMDMVWTSRFMGAEQVFTGVSAETDVPLPPPGSRTPLGTSYCVRVLDGRLPAVIPDTGANLIARELPATRSLGIGAYVGVPIRLSDGRVDGMLCAVSSGPRPELSEHDRGALDILAQLLADITERGEKVESQDAARARFLTAVEERSWSIVLHPVVDLWSGAATGVEALTRFHTAPANPAAWFAEATRAGVGPELELATAAAALTAPGTGKGLVGINLSPATLLSPGFPDLFRDIDLTRVALEITEHEVVRDYPAVRAALAPYRAAGLALAIDDAGAGYASFQHILQLQPDFIKIDISLVRGIDQDAAQAALVESLVMFTRTSGSEIVAEGVETQAELDTLARLGVTLAQGYLYGEPSSTPRLTGHPTPSIPFIGREADALVSRGRGVNRVLAQHT
jgi:EAL domain-containing protein (putative c-di-GMP-specific phosphodiesterase class I)